MPAAASQAETPAFVSAHRQTTGRKVQTSWGRRRERKVVGEGYVRTRTGWDRGVAQCWWMEKCQGGRRKAAVGCSDTRRRCLKVTKRRGRGKVAVEQQAEAHRQVMGRRVRLYWRRVATE